MVTGIRKGLLGLLALAILIPLTAHALNSHVGQYNASTLSSRVSDGGCKDKKFEICADGTARIFCTIKVDLVGGLIVGLKRQAPNIVAGYAARPSYWEKNSAKASCTPIAGWLFYPACCVLCTLFGIKRLLKRRSK